MVEARGGRKQPYLAAWDVKQTANRIFGFDGWAPRLLELRCIGESPVEKDGRKGWHVGYIAIVQVEIDGFPTALGCRLRRRRGVRPDRHHLP